MLVAISPSTIPPQKWDWRQAGESEILRPMPERNDRTVTADTDGVINHWGRNWESIFGYSAKEAIGRKVDLIIPPVLQARHWRGFNKAIQNGRLRRPDPSLKIPAVHKSGEIVPLRATLALTRSEDGEVDGAVATIFGRGPAWRGTAWRAVLAPLQLLHRARGARRR
jgi:PAS domain S-box-containing protein